MKKIVGYVFVLMFVVFAFSGVAHATTPTVTIGSQSAANGATINVPLTASNFANTVSGMDFPVQYDNTLLTYTGFTLGSAFTGHPNPTTNNFVVSGSTSEFRLNWFDTTALTLDTGTLITLNFTVISAANTTANLTFTGSTLTPDLSNTNGDIITSSFVPGAITLTLNKAITSFNFNALSPAVIGVVNESTKTVALTVPIGTDVTALVPSITLSLGASIISNTGVAQNFTTSQTYTVTAVDNSTQAYVVTVTLAASAPVIITRTGGGMLPSTITNTPVGIISGCVGTVGFSNVTGQSCFNNISRVIVGCGNRTTGFSVVNGQSCIGNIGIGNIITTNNSYDFGPITLRPGNRGNAVRELQRFLNDKLNLGLVLDGVLGPKTFTVVKQWQKDHGLVVDGLVGKKTKAMMYAEVQ